MKRTVYLHNIKLISLALMLALLAACAGSASKQQSIEDRVNAYLQLVLAGDHAGAYEYLSPGYRSSVSLNQYQRAQLLKKVKWTDASYIESDCTETLCKVSISIKYTVYGAVPGVKSFDSSQQVQESWVLADGSWYLVPEI